MLCGEPNTGKTILTSAISNILGGEVFTTNQVTGKDSFMPEGCVKAGVFIVHELNDIRLLANENAKTFNDIGSSVQANIKYKAHRKVGTATPVAYDCNLHAFEFQ